MNNEVTTAALCSGFLDIKGVRPLSFKEWHRLIACLFHSGIEDPGALDNMTLPEIAELYGMDNGFAKRIYTLLQKTEKTKQCLQQCRSCGIGVLGMDDDDYPLLLLQRLGDRIPPLFYYAGNKALLNQPAVSVTGTRQVSDAGKQFAAAAGRQIAKSGKVLVSGGAVGCDTIAEYHATANGGGAVLYLAVSLQKAMQKPRYQKLLQQGRLCLVADYNPFVDFSAHRALYRNQYIYQSAKVSLVCESKAGSGGTYKGATEAIQSGTAKVFINKGIDNAGNRMLIKNGGRPVTISELNALLKTTL